jgi:hypothetical protein
VEDYQDAAQRHWQDAEILHQQHPDARLANASHLYGVSAECALKVIARQNKPSMQFFGQSGHMPKLFTEIENISAVGADTNLVTSINQIGADFHDWSVNQRYENQSTAVFTTSSIARQKSGAQKAQTLMNNVLGGLV